MRLRITFFLKHALPHNVPPFLGFLFLKINKSMENNPVNFLVLPTAISDISCVIKLGTIFALFYINLFNLSQSQGGLI